MALSIRYQGFTCSDCGLVRSRGIQPDTLWVVIPVVVDWPEGFKVQAPKAGESLLLSPVSSQTTTGQGDPSELRFVGDLLLVDDRSSLRVERVYVRQVLEVMREPEEFPRAQRKTSLKLILSDERMLYSLGVMRDHKDPAAWLPRWSFNRLRNDGDYDLDSVKDSGEPFTLREVLAQFVSRSLPGAPTLQRMPDRDAFDRIADLEYEPFEPPALALQRAVDEYKTSDPVLTWGGDLALYDDGEGQIGYAGHGGVQNSNEIPPEYFEFDDSRGTSHQAEVTYPPQFAAVVGGKAIGTSSVDSWDFVLEINGRFWPLNEETVTKLTGDPTRGMAWLSRWIIAKAEHQDAAYLDKRVAKVLREQAWRLARLPQVEIEQDAPLGPEAPAEGAPPGGASDPLAQFRPSYAIFLDRNTARSSDQARFGAGPPAAGGGSQRITTAGPYAHLLPLLPQGQVQNGKRVPIEVQTYTHSVQHFAHRNTAEHQRWFAAKAALQAANDGILSALRGVSPLNQAPPVSMLDAWIERRGGRGSQRLGAGRAGLDDVWEIVRQEEGLGGTRGDVLPMQIERHLYHQRQIAALREDRPDLATIYEKAVVEELQARDAVAVSEPGNIPPRQELLWEAAKAILEFEGQLREQQGFTREEGTSLTGDGIRNVNKLASDPRNRVLKESLKRKIADLVTRIRNDRIEREALVGAGGGTELRAQQIQVLVNQARTVDTGARVYDAEAGVVRLGGLPGWIEDPVLKRAELGPVKNVVPGRAGSIRFVPAPVRVTFGHELRPRVDVAYGTPVEARAPRPITGADPEKLATAEPDHVLSAGSDAETTFVRYYRREASGGASPVEPALLVETEGPLVIRRPDLVELINADWNSNAASLEEVAREAAARRFALKEVVEGQSQKFAGLWEINPDGLIAQVRISTIKGPGGEPLRFRTEVITGTRVTLDAIHQGTRQRIRPPRVKEPDRATRGRLTK